MGPGDVTSRDAVVRAMREYDELGQEAFLAKYGFGRSTKFVVADDGREYDSKALLAAAHGFQHPDEGPLRSSGFSGGEQTTSRLQALGFTITSPTVVAAGVQFRQEDCAVFERYPRRVHWDSENIRPEDQALFKDIWTRLKSLAGWLAGSTQIDLPLKPLTSSYQANGRSQTDIWCCIYPADVPNKSYALQAALIISALGAEVCICLGAGSSQLKGVKLAEAELALEGLRSRLASVPPDVVAAVGQRLPQQAVYCSSWREFGGHGDFSTLADWLAYAAGPDGASASISIYIDAIGLERIGTNIGNVLLELADAAAPLFEYCYLGREAPPLELDDKEGSSRDTGETPDIGDVEAPEHPPTRPTLLAGATADTVPEPGDGRVRAADRLGIVADVEMLVSVLLARDTPLPLAVGLFGDWGSGKSFFMALMQERMGELSRLAAQEKPEAWPFCREVRLVRFNAWHYVDANLWASLAATMFDELALADAPDETQIKQNKLTELGEARQKAEQAREERQQLEDEVAKLEAKTARPSTAMRVSAAVAIHAVRDTARLHSSLRAARDGTATDPSALQLVNALGEIDTAAGKAGAAWRLFQEEVLHRLRWPTLITLLVLVGGAVLTWVAASWSAGLKALTLAGAVAAALLPALAATLRVLYLTREAREARELPLVKKRDKLAQAQARENDAKRQVAQREQELAELRDKGLQLQKFVHERAASSDYRGELGVISKIRRDFEQLAALLPGGQSTGPEQSAAVVAAVKQHVPEVERIVLFVDDLDRCPHEKVVEVLQAVHLLLAFKLFVVVVGVDSRWLERSLQAHYKDLLEEPDSYLEKIFQIPFVLRRMTLGRYRDLIDGLTTPPIKPSERSDEAPGSHLTTAGQATPPTDGVPDATSDLTEDSSNGTGSDTEESPPTAEDVESDLTGSAHASTSIGSDLVAPPATAVEVVPAEPPPSPRPEALVIGDDERELLGKVGGIVPTPRAAKRLVNIYRMLRVSVQESERDAFLPSGGSEYQAVVLLLGVLIGRPSRAHEVFGEIVGAADTDDVWELLTEFQDVYESLAALRSHIKVTQAGPYRRWAPRVARFSFRFTAALPDEESTSSLPGSS
jgi:KAP family P-loop domain